MSTYKTEPVWALRVCYFLMDIWCMVFHRAHYTKERLDTQNVFCTCKSCGREWHKVEY